jgi:hypothetical protein
LFFIFLCVEYLSFRHLSLHNIKFEIKYYIDECLDSPGDETNRNGNDEREDPPQPFIVTPHIEGSQVELSAVGLAVEVRVV